MNLEELWLGKNKIVKLEVSTGSGPIVESCQGLILFLQGLQTLRRLKILSIQSNRITKLEGLDELENLEEFYISHNGVKLIEGLENNVAFPLKLKILEVLTCFPTEKASGS